MYILIIGTIKETSKLEDRSSFQLTFKKTLDDVNYTFLHDIASKFTMTLGNQFQGLLKTNDHVFEIIDNIIYGSLDVEIEFAVGIGEVSTIIDESVCIGIDGTVFKHAQKAMKLMRKRLINNQTNLYIVGPIQNERLDLINTSSSLVSFQVSHYTNNQKEFVFRSIHDFGYNEKTKQVYIARTFSMSNQMVNKRIQSTGFYTLIQLKNTLNQNLIKYITEVA